MIISLRGVRSYLCLNLSNSFSAFNKDKLIHLAHFYPDKFFIMDLMVLGYQFDMYIIDLHNDNDFFDIKGIASLAEKMVKIKNDSLERVFQISIYAWYIYFLNCHYFY
jgi:hypothetical protein